MNALAPTLLWCFVQVTLLTAFTALLYFALGRRSPGTRSLATFTALVLVVGLTALAFSPWPRWSVEKSLAGVLALQSERQRDGGNTAGGGDVRTAGGEEAQHGEAVTETASTGQKRSAAAPSFASLFLESVLDEVRAPAAAAQPVNDRWTWRQAIAGFFGIAAGMGLVRLVLGLLAVRTYRRQSRSVSDRSLLELRDILQASLCCPGTVDLCESDHLATPATIGWRRPVVILPANWRTWTDDELRAVLAHEIAHIRRYDFLTWACAQGALVLHFYHPLVHWLAGRLRLEQELAADAAAAAISGGQQVYLKTLAAMALRQSEVRIAWPARTFLPSRGTFLRRIEMLRDVTLSTTSLSRVRRLATVCALVVAGLAIAGLRGPAAPQIVAAAGPIQTPVEAAIVEQALAPAIIAAGEEQPLSNAFVPRDVGLVIALRPAALLARPELADVSSVLKTAVPWTTTSTTTTSSGGRGGSTVSTSTSTSSTSTIYQDILEREMGVATNRIQQATIIWLNVDELNRLNPSLVLKFGDRRDAQRVMQHLFEGAQDDEYDGQTYRKRRDGRVGCLVRPDGQTVILAAGEYALRRMLVTGAAGPEEARWQEHWTKSGLADVICLLNSEVFAADLDRALKQGTMPTVIAALAPLWQNATTAVVRIAFPEKLNLDGSVVCKSPDDARAVADSLKAAFARGRTSLSEMRDAASRVAGAEGASSLRALDAGGVILDTIEVGYTAGKDRLDLGATGPAGNSARLLATLLPATLKARRVVRLSQSKNNLKQIARALHSYYEKHQKFPPAVLYGPDGKAAYSWRVAILPFLDEQALYDEYRFDEPWDSLANQRVQAKMPEVFRDLGDSARSTNSAYFVLVSEEAARAGVAPPAAFEGGFTAANLAQMARETSRQGPVRFVPLFSSPDGAKIGNVMDGTSNTLMVVEAARDIPWTKPEDILYVPEKPMPMLGGRYADGFLAALADGQVVMVPTSIDEKVLRALITINDGVPIPEGVLLPPTGK